MNMKKDNQQSLTCVYIYNQSTKDLFLYRSETKIKLKSKSTDELTVINSTEIKNIQFLYVQTTFIKFKYIIGHK